MLSTLLATHGGGPGWWIVVPFLWFALWVGIVAFVLTRFRRGCPPWARRAGHSVLDERYARGEIDVDEYRVRRDVLREGDR